MTRQILQDIITANEPIFQEKREEFGDGSKIGEIEFENEGVLAIYAFPVKKELSERSGKKAQYDLGKYILKNTSTDAGIFIFYDKNGNFRFSLIYANYLSKRRDWSTFRRFTYFVSKNQTNKTFLKQIGDCTFSSLAEIKEAFSVEKVTKEFYREIAYWYYWAREKCQFPPKAEEIGKEISIIRLITRLIFVWFMREFDLIEESLFKKEFIEEKVLKNLNPQESTYYKAILQNLFFAVLNTPKEKREFRTDKRYYKGYNPDYGNHNKFRYKEFFKDPGIIKKLFDKSPFLNGGLFECLDLKPKNGEFGERTYIDGFTDTKKFQPKVPNELFFSDEKEIDLNEIYRKSIRYKVRGIINILSSYNFTIDENTPDDQEVALDPELLGKIFENLLAEYNPETSTTARKITGSYYTPREIVDYMVNESLKEYLKSSLKDTPQIEEKINKLFNVSNEDNTFDEKTSRRIVECISNIKIVDPAVGSGAFLMAALNKMVEILNKVDPDNKFWKEVQLKPLRQIPDPSIRAKLRRHIEEIFKTKLPNYSRKLYLIQNCLYGVDIQPIAVEIARLRFFISLLIDEDKKNIQPLPNLDFKLMQGNSLISEFEGISLDDQNNKLLILKDISRIDTLIDEFEKLKEEYLSEYDPFKKREIKRKIEEILFEIISAKLEEQQEEIKRSLRRIEEQASQLKSKEQREKYIESEKQAIYKKYKIDPE